MAVIIDGRAIARQREEDAAVRANSLKSKGITPGLAVVLVGDDPASRVYVNMKKRACARVGLFSEEVALPSSSTTETIISTVQSLNGRPDIHGILVQLPLPRGIDTNKVIASVSPLKDVDGFHPVNLGGLLMGSPSFIPCTPAGVMHLIRSTGVEIQGKECVVVGRSLIVGKPMSLLLLAEHGTVTICHSRTHDLAEVCRRADILVAAVGQPGLITGDMVKPGAVVIDVGTNRVGETLVGDVEFDSASRIAGFITPVPGGVGPMTISELLQNTVRSAELAPYSS